DEDAADYLTFGLHNERRWLTSGGVGDGSSLKIEAVVSVDGVDSAISEGRGEDVAGSEDEAENDQRWETTGHRRSSVHLAPLMISIPVRRTFSAMAVRGSSWCR